MSKYNFNIGNDGTISFENRHRNLPSQIGITITHNSHIIVACSSYGAQYNCSNCITALLRLKNDHRSFEIELSGDLIFLGKSEYQILLNDRPYWIPKHLYRFNLLNEFRHNGWNLSYRFGGAYSLITCIEGNAE